MTTIKKWTAVTNGGRDHDLRKMLETRRRKLGSDVQSKIRDGRDHTNEREVLDEGESSEVDVQDEIGFALIQMEAETLKKVDASLRRLREGTYGVCCECGGEIPEARLRALPFAVRCKECEEAREVVDLRERAAQRRFSTMPYGDPAN